MKLHQIIGLGLFLFIGLQTTISQTTKTFQGAFENGTATYQYYENENFERTFQGSFKYKGSVADGLNVKYNYTVTGQYNKDKKDGLWTYILANPLPKGTKETVTGAYENGMMEGLWSLTTIVNSTKKSIKKSTVYFKKNKLIGEFNYEYTAYVNKEYATVTVRGNFNDSSLFNGAWITNYAQGNIQFEDIRKYKNGVLYWLMHRRLSDGKIIQKIDSTTFVEQFFQNYNPEKKAAQIGDQKFVFNEGVDKYTGNLDIPVTVINYWIAANRNSYFNVLSSPNPVFMIEHGFQPTPCFHEKFIINWLNTKDGEKQLWQNEQTKKLTDEKYKEIINKADTAFVNKNYSLAIEVYKQALTIKKDIYPEEQIKKAQQIIDDINKSKEQERQAVDKVYNEIIIKADQAFKDNKLEVSIELYQSALGVKGEKYPKDQIEKIKSILFEKIKENAIQEQEKLWITVDAGEFKMGCFRSDINCLKNEEPIHNVTVSSYKISKYEVTNAQYKAYCKVNGLKEPQGADSIPVINISWDEAAKFAEWLGCRLPTEAEWEFAARGGVKNKKSLFAGSNDIDEVAWFSENSDKVAHPVGKKQPNILGLYDMSGNVWEWCSDWYGDYPDADLVDPVGIEKSTSRVKRGGSFSDTNFEVDLNVTNRASEPADFRSYNLGFRLVKK